MGCIYRHKGRATWWIKWKAAGRWQYTSADSHRREDAVRLLRLKEGDTAKGLPVTSQVGRLRFEEARDDLFNFHKMNGRDTSKIEARIKKHMTPFFGGMRMADLTVATVNAYVVARLKSGCKPATVNRELAWLKHMFNLAVRAGKLMVKPHITLLRESNIRKGFLEEDQLPAVLGALPEDLRPVVEFAYITGWRLKSEVLGLEWRQVDLKAGEIRLEPGTTKNDRGRTFPFTQRLRTLLEAQHAEAERLKKRGKIVPWVFFRMVALGRKGPLRPKPIKTLTKALSPNDLRVAVERLNAAAVG